MNDNDINATRLWELFERLSPEAQVKLIEEMEDALVMHRLGADIQPAANSDWHV